MEKDIAPELLEAIRERLREKEGRDPQIAAFTEKLNARKATQGDVAQYSGRLGELLSETLREILTPDNLPERKLYYNIAARTIMPMLRNVHQMVNDSAIQAQKAIDEENGIGMKAVPAAFPEKRVNDLMYKIGSEETTPEQAQTLMGEPIENNCRKFFDEHVRHNADVRFKAGLSPMIVRTTHGGCCKWCASVAGKYEYGDVSDTGNDVFRRHGHCRCTVEYVCDGKKQDVWSKKMWQADKETLEKRAAYGLERQKKKPTNRKDDRKRQELIAEYNKNREKALANADNRDIIKSRDVKHLTIQSIDLPIEQRNSGKGNPNAIRLYDVELSNRQKKVLDSLPENGSSFSVSKKDFNMRDLSSLTAKTGCEFAMFTKGNERLIIRGDALHVEIGIEDAKELAAQGFRWSGHTHPGETFLAMQPSDGDYAILDCFAQKNSVIYNSKGEFRTYEKRSE